MKLTEVKHEFIQWSSSDEEGPFAHVGKLLGRRQGMVTMQLGDGTVISFPEDDGIVEPARMPKDWGAPAPSAPERVGRPQQPRAPRAPQEGSKKMRAIQMYQTAEDKSKAAIVNLFMSDLGMTPAGAQTYFYMVKKAAG